MASLRVPLLWIKGTFLALLIWGFVPAKAQESRIDSLILAKDQLPEDSAKVEALFNLGIHFQEADLKKSLGYLEEALKLGKKLGLSDLLAYINRELGIGYFLQRDHTRAILHLTESMSLYEALKDTTGIEKSAYDLGSVYSDLGDFEKALDYFLTNLSLMADTSRFISYTYGHLSHIYERLGNPTESQKYENLSLKTGEKSKSPQVRLWVYIVQIEKLIEKEQYKEAMNRIDIAWKYASDHQMTNYNESLLEDRAIIYSEQGQYALALSYARESIELYKSKGADPLPEQLILLGNIYFDMGNYTRSIQTAEEALQVVKKQGADIFELKIYELLARNYESISAYAKAYEIRTTQLEVQKNIQEKNSADVLAKMQTRFQIKEQEAENTRLRKEGVRHKKELELSQNVVRQQRIITGISILGFVFVSGLFFYVARLLKKIRATNHRLEEQSYDLRIAKDKAESAAKAKSEFLSVMSHEIRTPMNAVIGMTEFLMDEEPREDQMEYLDTHKFSGNNLIALINDILDFSKIEAGKLTLEQADMDLRSIAKSITASTAIKGQDKGLKVGVSYADDLVDTYVGDAVRLGQVLTNLMGNAVKFTEQGHVELQISEVGEDTLRFCVEDTGIGIPKHKQQKIFEAFSQAEENTTRKFGGTGLGLSISRRLVSLMGGELQIESEPGKGSKFFFDIHLPKGDQKLKTQKEQSSSGKLTFGSLAGTRVLVAEDNKINQMVARKFLEKWDLDVDIVNDGQEAVDAWEKGTYDLILMDVNMPVLNGSEATCIIREREAGRDQSIPILAFTASVIEGEINAIYQAGMNDWVGKPFEPNVLYQKIKKYTTEAQVSVST